MKELFSELTKSMTLSPGLHEEELNKFISSLPTPLPEDFKSFLKFSNGAEGEIGNNYLVVWGTEVLVQYNEAYSVEIFAPGLFLFGSDGGGTAYGFDLREKDPIVVDLPFIGMDWSIAKKRGNNFIDFLHNLSALE